MDSHIQINEIIQIKINSTMKAMAEKKADQLQNIADRRDLEPRDVEWRKKDLYKGEIAELAVIEYLIQNKKKVKRVEKDIKNDIILYKQGEELKVEIKSSGPATNTPNFMVCLTQRNLAVKPGEEKEINIQAYYFLEDADKYIYLIGWISDENLVWIDKEKNIRRRISKFSLMNPRKRFDMILEEMHPMKKLLDYVD